MKVLKPQRKRLLLRRELVKQIGMIIIPDKTEEMKACFAEVIDQGIDCIDGHAPGTIVYFGRYAPQILNSKELSIFGITSVDPDKEEYLILNEEDVLCTVEDEQEVA
jgi:co-chaperonin GroES (HSP10)